MNPEELKTIRHQLERRRKLLKVYGVSTDPEEANGEVENLLREVEAQQRVIEQLRDQAAYAQRLEDLERRRWALWNRFIALPEHLRQEQEDVAEDALARLTFAKAHIYAGRGALRSISDSINHAERELAAAERLIVKAEEAFTPKAEERGAVLDQVITQLIYEIQSAIIEAGGALAIGVLPVEGSELEYVLYWRDELRRYCLDGAPQAADLQQRLERWLGERQEARK